MSAYIGWYRDRYERKWWPLPGFEGAKAEVQDMLDSFEPIECGDKLVLPAGQDPNETPALALHRPNPEPWFEDNDPSLG